MRWTELIETPTTAAMVPAVQCVASCGGSVFVKATTRSMTVWSSGAMRGGRVFSRTRPSTPSTMYRSCQRQTQVFDLPVSRMIAWVPRAAAIHDPRTPDVLLDAVMGLGQEWLAGRLSPE